MAHFIRENGNKTNSTEKEKKFKKEEKLFMKVILLRVKNKEKVNSSGWMAPAMKENSKTM